MPYRPKIKKSDGTLADLPLEAETSIKLKTERMIGLSGVKAVSKPFNGSADITIPIMEVPTTLLHGKIVNSQIQDITPDKITGLLDMIYPIGSVKLTKIDKNPGEYLGGNWIKASFTEPTNWIVPETTPFPIMQNYWDAGIGKSIIDIKNKIFRFKKTDIEIIQMVASGIHHIGPGNATDLFNIQHLTPLGEPHLITNRIPNLVIPWQVHWNLDNVVIQEDDTYFYVIVFDYFATYDPDLNTPEITGIPLRYFVNCITKRESMFEYTTEAFNYEWLRIK